METNINLNDMVTMVNIIDACTERGAFKGNELVTIGTLREKLANFVRANQPKTEATETTENTESAE
jgi:hypothetical protein